MLEDTADSHKIQWFTATQRCQSYDTFLQLKGLLAPGENLTVTLRHVFSTMKATFLTRVASVLKCYYGASSSEVSSPKKSRWVPPAVLNYHEITKNPITAIRLEGPNKKKDNNKTREKQKKYQKTEWKKNKNEEELIEKNKTYH